MNINPTADRPREENRIGIVMQTALRRELQRELIDIGQILGQQVDPDAMTEEIIDWHRMFTEALSRGEAETVIEHFIPLLQDILVDPISQGPLDEEAYLGSDGNAYGHRTLFLYRHGAPQNLRDRSPLNPDNPEVFTVSPHIVVRELVRWLQRHNALLRSEEHDRLYEELMRQINPPRPIDDRAERLRRIQERQAGIQQERQRELGEFRERIRQDVAQEVERAFQPIQERIVEIGAEQAARINALALRDQERIEIVQNNLGNQNPIQQAQAFQRQLNHVQNIVENTLEAQIAELEKGINKVNSNNRMVSTQINNLDHQCQEIQVQIRETEIAIKKAKKAKIKQVFVAVACVGACVFATWAVIGLEAAIGANAAVTPVNPGGAMLTLGVAI